MPLRAVLFDYGHTLVDFHRTEEALLLAYQEIKGRIEAAGYLEMPEILDLIERAVGDVERIVGASYAERRMEELDLVAIFTEALQAVGFTLPQDVIEHIVAIDHSAFSNSLSVKPETITALERLAGEGYRMGLVSNVTLLPHLMRADLESLGLARFFDRTTFSSETGVRKPDPRIFQAVLVPMGVDPREAAFVGDRLLDDVAGAQSLGMRAVQTLEFRQEEDEVRPDAVIRSLPELPALLAGWRDAETEAVSDRPAGR
jgi:HAD superfamily hydrolase (TIGR01549 family)